jgi:hypothetical protein
MHEVSMRGDVIGFVLLVVIAGGLVLGLLQ